MPKPTLEFTPVAGIPVISGADTSDVRLRVLSHDPETGDKTVILYHPPGQEWGGSEGKESSAVHDYWEEVLILKGRLYDKTLKTWFAAEHYCCRPPGMIHGPWLADPEAGCEEIVFIRYPVERTSTT